MAVKTLESVYRHFFLMESERVLRTFLNSEESYVKCFYGTHQLAIEACVIRLHDCWARYCRELIFCSAAESPLTLSGAVLAKAAGVVSRKDVIPLIKAGFKASKRSLPFGEPRWADSAQCMDSVKILSLSNSSTILAAIGSTPSPSDDLRKVRNYIAHRNESTAKELQSVAKTLPAAKDLYSLLSNPLPPTGTSVFEQWILQLRVIAIAAIH